MSENHMRYIGAAEANMMSWLMEIHNAEDVPSFFQEEFRNFKQNGEMPYTVYCPGQKPGRKDRDAKLLCMDTERIMIAARGKKSFIVKLNDIKLMSITRVLLSSMLRVFSESEEADIDFNSVCKLLINHVINARRKIDASAPEIKLPEGILSLRETDYKGYAIALAELQGARPMNFWLRQQKIKGRFSFMPPRIAAQMLFVTDDEFIWVTENEKEAYASRSYGGTSYYVFLKDINDVTLKYKHGDVIVISVRIQGGQELTLKLPAFRENEARQIVERLK